MNRKWIGFVAAAALVVAFGMGLGGGSLSAPRRRSTRRRKPSWAS